MTLATQGVGRDGSSALLRALLILASRLAEEGDSVSASQIVRLFGASRLEAQELLQALLNVGDEDMPRYLPLFDNGDEVGLAQTPSHPCRPLRLSHLETMALAAAFDLVGLKSGNALRKRIMTQFACPDDAGDSFAEAASPPYPIPTRKLLSCATAIVSKRALTFDYQGTRDDAPRKRRAMPSALNPNDGRWTLDAFDLDADGERTFYITNMRNITLLDEALPRDAAADSVKAERRTVRLRFADRHMLELFEWPDLEILRESDGVAEARIPFYGGPWLVRRIAAGGGSVTTDDAELNALVRSYAESLLQ